MATGNPWLSSPAQANIRKIIVTLPPDLELEIRKGDAFRILMSSERGLRATGDESPSPPRKSVTDAAAGGQIPRAKSKTAKRKTAKR